MRILFLTMLILAPAGAATFTFETIANDTTTPLSLTDNGLTATFSSPVANAFFVSPTFFSTLTGQVLLDADEPANALNILFSQSIASFSVLFAMNGLTTDSFLLEAFAGGIGGTSRGSTSATGVVPDGFAFPEGSVSHANALGFNAVRLTSTTFDFAIDDVEATLLQAPPTDIPEPLTTALVFGGVALLVLRRRRKQA